MAESMFEFAVTPHATRAMLRRGIRLGVLREVLASPAQRSRVRPGREVLQSIIEFPDGSYLVRVIVDVATQPPVVVTVYRTSKIEKYWSRSS